MSMNMASFLRRRTAARRFAGAWHAVLAAVLLISAVDAQRADACSCFANPPCAAVWKADAVFIGTVVDRAPERIGGSLSWTVHKVAVGQTLRGSVDSFLTLVPGNRPTAEQIEASKSHPGESMTMSTCDYGFELGKQYVIYARRTPDGRWTTSIRGLPISTDSREHAPVLGLGTNVPLAVRRESSIRAGH
jgi:hypothetical protein